MATMQANQKAFENDRLAIAQRDAAVAAYHAQGRQNMRAQSQRAAALARFVDGLRSKGVPDEFIFAAVPDSGDDAAFQSAAAHVEARCQELRKPPAAPARAFTPAVGALTPGMAAYAQGLAMP